MVDRKEYMKEYHRKNKEKVSAVHKKWLERNPGYCKKYCKQWRESNPGYFKEWQNKNKECINEEGKNYYQENKEYYKEYRRKYYQNNKEKCNEYERNKRKIDIKDNLNNRMSNAIWKSIKGNKAGRNWEDLVGYKLKDLISRLISTMPEGYNWQDYLNGELHIDHIIPKSVFNYKKSEHIDFQRCWALKNLRLILIKENLIKSNHLEKPFQPALAI